MLSRLHKEIGINMYEDLNLGFKETPSAWLLETCLGTSEQLWWSGTDS